MELTWINLTRFQQKNSDSHRLIIIGDISGVGARQNPLCLSIDRLGLRSSRSILRRIEIAAAAPDTRLLCHMWGNSRSSCRLSESVHTRHSD